MIDVNGTSHARYGVRYINTVGPRRETSGALVNSSERGRRRLGNVRAPALGPHVASSVRSATGEPTPPRSSGLSPMSDVGDVDVEDGP